MRSPTRTSSARTTRRPRPCISCASSSTTHDGCGRQARRRDQLGIDHERYRHAVQPAAEPRANALAARSRLSEASAPLLTTGAVAHARALLESARLFPREHADRSSMSQTYTAQDIEVLSGLEPVRRRPGMYTDTSRPNHLAQEVVDNSVDEALAGHCSRIDVTLHKDGSVEVIDDGRGMPVDIHPKEKVSGVELILTRLHAGGKFSDRTYKFSGGLHGVGVSVVNALSKQLECWVRRDGKEYNIAFRNGEGPLEARSGRRPSASATPAPRCASGRIRSTSTRRDLAAEAQARAQGQGRAVPGAAGPPHGREERREGRVALHGRPRAVSARIARVRRMAARRAVHRQHRGQAGGGRLGGRVACRRRRRGSRKATSI